MGRIYRAATPNGEFTTTDEELAKFKSLYLTNRGFADRVSELFLFDLYVYDVAFGISPIEILETIRALEGEPVRAVATKPPSEFRNLPLRGLWHKHFFSAQFMVQNIFLGLGRNGVERLVNEVMDPAKSSVVTQEMIDELSYRAVNDPLEARSAAGRLTGEWIIYLPRGGENYYLCLNTHSAGDQAIFDRVMVHCVRDFPELPRWIEEARA